VEKIKKLSLMSTCLATLTDSVCARGGGSEAGGELFLGILGVLVGFALSKQVGNWLLPNADEALQGFVGFFIILVGIGVLGSHLIWWLGAALFFGGLYYFINRK